MMRGLRWSDGRPMEAGEVRRQPRNVNLGLRRLGVAPTTCDVCHRPMSTMKVHGLVDLGDGAYSARLIHPACS